MKTKLLVVTDENLATARLYLSLDNFLADAEDVYDPQDFKLMAKKLRAGKDWTDKTGRVQWAEVYDEDR
jgi:hypothetical protein